MSTESTPNPHASAVAPVADTGYTAGLNLQVSTANDNNARE